jgi:uncharacterized Tic20 family protein
MGVRSSWNRIGLVLLLAAGVQTWMVARNPVPAQDAIVFLRFARQLDHQPVLQVLSQNDQHPLYPLVVWLTHRASSSWCGDNGSNWIRCAQIVAATAAVLVVVPMFLAGVRLGDRNLAAGAAGLFSVLPFMARAGADALSDSTYLLFFMTGFWAATEFFSTGRRPWLFVAGLAVGAAYLARPEAVLLSVAVGVTLAISHWKQRRIIGSRRESIAALATLGFGVLIVVSPYVAATGKITPKGSLVLFPGGMSLHRHAATDESRPRTAQLSDGSRVVAPLRLAMQWPSGEPMEFGLRHRTSADRLQGYAAAMKEIVRELVEGLHYILCVFAFVGIVRAPRQPANLLASVLALVFAVVLCQFASQAGYVASRHVLPLVALGCYVAARGGWTVAGWLTELVDRPQGFARLSSFDSVCERFQPRFAAALLVAAIAFCLPRSFTSLHQSREAHVAAGRWVAQHAAGKAVMLDSRGWASLYAELPAYDYHGARLAFEDPSLAYVVVEDGELRDAGPRGATLRRLLALAGRKEAEFSTNADPAESVHVYRWHPERLALAVTVRPTMRAN